jgi:predicted ATP-grasp superfamily ATP-dependent carboligase
MAAANPPAFILGVEHPRGIACVRSLARAGVPVVVVDYQIASSAAPYVSRYVGERAFIDPRQPDAAEQLEHLAGERGGVLIPTNDEYLIFAAKHHERLSRTFTMSHPAWDRLEPLMDRMSSARLARRAGLETIPIFAPADETELEDTLAQLDFANRRYVLKLELWTDGMAETTLCRKTTYGGQSVDELRVRYLEILARTGEYPSIQELVPGTTDASIGVTIVADTGSSPVATYSVRRLKLQTYSEVDDFRHPYDLGGNVFCETVHEPEAARMAEDFVRRSGWFGVITVEFRRDALDGRLKFVKVDPRVIRSTALSAAVGMDVPTAIYGVAVGRPPLPPSVDYPAGACWIWLDNYFESLWRNRRRASVRRELFGLLRRAPDIRAFACLSVRDPLPAVSQVLMRLTLARKWVQPKRFADLTGVRTGRKPPTLLSLFRMRRSGGA